MKLWQHQKDMRDYALEKLNRFGYVWWQAGCGIGKTMASIAVAQQLGGQTLVLSPVAAMTAAWLADVTDFTDFTIDLMNTEDSYFKAETITNSTADFIVINYESARIKHVAEAIEAKGFTFVIADESHRLQNHESLTYKSLYKATRNIPYKLAMTGTGWANKPLSVYGQASWLGVNMGKYDDFFNTYTHWYSPAGAKYKIAKGYKNLPILGMKIKPYTLEVNAESVLDLPEEQHIYVNLQFPKKLRNFYNELRDEYIAWYESDPTIIDYSLVLRLRLHQLTGGYRQGRYTEGTVPTPKLDGLVEVIDSLGGKPVVVFTNFTSEVKLIAEKLDSLGISYSRLTGEVHEHDAWQRGEGGQVMIANFRAGSEGINLTRADTIIYYSVTDDNMLYTQSLARIRRASQKANRVTYYYLLVEDSIDHIMLNNLRSKEDRNKILKSNLTTI